MEREGKKAKGKEKERGARGKERKEESGENI